MAAHAAVHSGLRQAATRLSQRSRQGERRAASRAARGSGLGSRVCLRTAGHSYRRPSARCRGRPVPQACSYRLPRRSTQPRSSPASGLQHHGVPQADQLAGLACPPLHACMPWQPFLSRASGRCRAPPPASSHPQASPAQVPSRLGAQSTCLRHPSLIYKTGSGWGRRAACPWECKAAMQGRPRLVLPACLQPSAEGLGCVPGRGSAPQDGTRRTGAAAARPGRRPARAPPPSAAASLGCLQGRSDAERGCLRQLRRAVLGRPRRPGGAAQPPATALAAPAAGWGARTAP